MPGVVKIARRACAAFLLAGLVAGCANTLIVRGEIQEDRFDAVLNRTEFARGISLSSDINVSVIDRREVAGIVVESIADSWPAEDIDRYTRSLVTVGLWPKDRGYLETYGEILGDSGAGLYVPRNRALYIVENPAMPVRERLSTAFKGSDGSRETALSHEIAHALQHQAYPDLMDMMESLHEHDDLQFAISAAIEGDAVRTSFEAAAGGTIGLPPPPALDAELNRMAGEEPLSRVPALMRNAFVSAYSTGYRMASAESAALLDSPPASSEQAIYPEKRREPFLVFDLTKVVAALADDCEVIGENTVGELGLLSLLTEHGAAKPTLVSNGWNGDRYLALECEGESSLFWVSDWDSEHDAKQFAGAYGEIAASVSERAGYSVPGKAVRDGSRVVVSTSKAAPAAEDGELIVSAKVGTVRELRAFYDLK